GAGHSLVLARPSYGERFPQAWGISDQVGGSPGGYDSVSSSPQRSVVINEFFANSEPPDVDYIELYNHSNLPVDLSGCALSDDSHTNKFLMPANTIIPARGFLALNQDQLGFCLSSSGETIYFRSADGRRVLDAVRYEPQARGVSSGRYPDGAKEFYPLSARTPGAANARILIRDIVINEIMYSPITTLSDDEYVELYNKSSNPVSLGGWAFTSGIDYTFPSNVVLAANNYLVVAKNVSRLLTNYANLNSNNTYGNYKGTLGNNGDRVALGMPDFNITTNCLGQVKTNDVYVVVDEVTYGTGGNWPKWADGGGSSLELIDPRSNHRQAHNWADSDETAKADWTTVEATGLMDNGAVTANWFEVLAMGEGEYLLDDAWAAPTTSSSNYIPTTNSNFEAGIGDWKVRGTMERSSLELTGGFGGGQCLHIRASTRGDTMANRCLVQIPGLPTSGSVTLRAQVRWLRGWPEILLRTKGNYMEAYGRLSVPANLGTPGLPNSRAATNAPPAIYEVKHTPVVPAAGQPVVVTARVDDPDGLASVVLNYRIDSSNSPAPIYMPVNMVDNGTGGDAVGGDGLYSAIIPAQPSGTMVAFQVVATDTLGAAKVFPLQDASYFNPFECLVRFGDPVIAASFGTYRQWMSLSNIIYWSTRATSYLNNEQIYETFVYGNFRAIYNARSKWASSPYHPPASLNPVIDPANYSIDMPPDDLFLGVANINKVHAPGNGPFGDQTIQREQICYWMARQMGLPWGYRRYVNMFFNGNRRGGTTAMMEDAQTPGADMLAQFFPDEPDGNLFKLQPWFEQNDAQSSGANNQSWCTLVRFTTVSNGVTVHKTARYRNNYLTRNASGTANNFQPVFDLVDAANSTGEALTANFSAVTDTEEYFRILSVEHASGNWDAIGSQNQQNMYGYVTKDRKWHLMIWDWNIVLGSASSDTGSWGVGQFLTGYNYSSPGPVDLPMQGLFANPTFRRIYFRGLKELATGPMLAARIEPVLDAKYRAFLASGVTPVSPGPPSDVKSFISGQRSAILTFIAAEDAAAFKITVPSTITTNNNLIAITGEAPVEAKTIKINGMDYPITWTSVRAFRILIAATTATNDLSLQAYDLKGNPLPGFGANLRFVYTGSFPAPETALVINEIMYNPTVPEASYIELYNNSDFAFDLTGWRVNGLDFTFRDHAAIASHQYLVLAKNRRAFSFAYGGSVAPAGEFDGHLDLGGETLTLQRPVLVYTTNAAVVITNIAYVTVN
ncbi:MAG TPA: lamin tail domain-containing protein, partial [Candidatus Binatia bacterium]|nr:lamin tail domain-containing protein [Candidatus Binatia bacterium]